MTRLTREQVRRIRELVERGDTTHDEVYRLCDSLLAALDVVEACNVRHWEAAITCLRDNDMTGSAEDLAAVADALYRFDAGSRP